MNFKRKYVRLQIIRITLHSLTGNFKNDLINYTYIYFAYQLYK